MQLLPTVWRAFQIAIIVLSQHPSVVQFGTLFKTFFSVLCSSSRLSRTACVSCGTCRTGWPRRRLKGSRWDRRSWTGFCAPTPAERMLRAPAAGARRKRKRRATIRWAGPFYPCSWRQLASLSGIRVRVACVDTRPTPVDNYVFSRLISFSF